MGVLDRIALPADLRNLSITELNEVAKELREELIVTVAASGGHFASSLGATELTVVLHHLFNTPTDRLVWDVGHQGYIHKMLTGRREQLSKIRTKEGISGFLKRDESPFDCFGAGHAGTSISAAVGLRCALDQKAKAAGNPDGDPRYVVAIIGDGSLTAGMAFEALNHAGALGLKRFIVVLNDNEMSISPNVGAVSWLFSRAITSASANFARHKFKQLYQQGYVPEIVYKVMDRAEEAAQSFIAHPSHLFAGFGFRYIGPVDGHNIEELCQAFSHAKEQDVPVLVHAYTTKGKGYEPAEEDPITWHGVVPFSRESGAFVAAQKKAPSYTQVFAKTLIEEAKKDRSIVAITAAMAGGTGLDAFLKELPEQFYDVGICEQHAVTFAAGLACEGQKPVCAIYSTFLQRAYDQIIHDVCIQNLPVVFAIDRAGVVGNDGETHQGVFDLSFLRTIPQIIIMSPAHERELAAMIPAALSYNAPVALRYPRGNGYGLSEETIIEPIQLGRGVKTRSGSDVLPVGLGPLVYGLEKLADEMAANGISCAVINARFAKPLDHALFAQELPHYRQIIVVEDHALMGGFGSAVLECISDHKISLQAPLIRLGVSDAFVAHASQDEQRAALGYDLTGVKNQILATIPAPQRLKTAL